MKRITLYADENVWRAFRMACMQEGRGSASKVVAAFMAQQVAEWEQRYTKPQRYWDVRRQALTEAPRAQPEERGNV